MVSGRFRRTSGGRWENKSSRDLTPMADSISRRSRSDFGRYRNGGWCGENSGSVPGFLSSYIILIIFGGEKTLNFVRGRQFYLNKPGVAMRILVQLFRRGGKQRVDFIHNARDRRVDIGN